MLAITVFKWHLALRTHQGMIPIQPLTELDCLSQVPAAMPWRTTDNDRQSAAVTPNLPQALHSIPRHRPTPRRRVQAGRQGRPMLAPPRRMHCGITLRTEATLSAFLMGDDNRLRAGCAHCPECARLRVKRRAPNSSESKVLSWDRWGQAVSLKREARSR